MAGIAAAVLTRRAGSGASARLPLAAWAAAALAIALAWPVPARAQESAAASTVAPAGSSAADAATDGGRGKGTRASPLMWSLYVTTAAVQGLDAHSTFRAIDTGAVERNPLLGSIADHRPAFVALKAGIATATIYAGHHLSRRHKGAALVGINVAYGALVARNYRIATRGR
jgi:hypothetical protein